MENAKLAVQCHKIYKFSKLGGHFRLKVNPIYLANNLKHTGHIQEYNFAQIQKCVCHVQTTSIVTNPTLQVVVGCKTIKFKIQRCTPFHYFTASAISKQILLLKR